jgi:hypothetical protein
MKNYAVIPIILSAFISFSFSTSCSNALASGEFLQDTDAVYITINQVVDQGEPQVPIVNLFDTASTSGDSAPVEINLENPLNEVSRITMNVCDEDDYLALMRCEVTERTEGFLCRAFDGTDGCSSVMLFSMTGSSAIAQGTGPIFTLQYAVSDEAPLDECRVLTTESVDAMDASGFPLQVISSQGEYCFLEDVEPEEPPDGDTDGDGILDGEDQCPNSRLENELSISIDNCDTGVENRDLMDGCSMNDLIDKCAEDAAQAIFTHGRFVSCVALLTIGWKKDGLIDFKEKAAIQKCAAQSDLPWIQLNLD